MKSELKRQNKEYQKSLIKYKKFQDNDKLLKCSPKIDLKSSKLLGKSIGEIYDDLVTGPEAKPKKIVKQKGSFIVYDDESENNGGYIKGTNIRAFDDKFLEKKTCKFTNEF